MRSMTPRTRVLLRFQHPLGENVNLELLIVASYFAAALVAAICVFCCGKHSANTVWDRTKVQLKTDAYEFSVTMPFVTATEAILIFAAVMLRSPFMLVAAIYRELKLQSWERSPKMRQIDSDMRSKNDVLGSVSTIISGYPERARSFLVAQRGAAIARHFQAYFDDQEAIEAPVEHNQKAFA